MAEAGHHGPPPGLHLYTRDGFVGQMAVAIRPHTVYEYTSVTGPHAPSRVALDRVECADATDPRALPTVFATTRNGVSLSVSRRSAPMPYVFRNTECDELHFVQEGSFEYVTDFGALHAGPGDFVAIGRTVTYRVTPSPDNAESLRFVVETPDQLNLAPPAPFGMVNVGRDLTEKISKGEGTWDSMTTDGVHPSDAGYAAYAKSVARFLESHKSDSVSPPRLNDGSSVIVPGVSMMSIRCWPLVPKIAPEPPVAA